MKILVAIDAPIDNYSKIKKKISRYDLIIAADGAARHLQALSLTPSIIVGDFDSFRSVPKEWKRVELIKYPKEKDVSDGELAINLAIEKGAKVLDIIGLTGGALDHTIANLEVFRRIPRNIEATVLNENKTIYRITSDKEIVSSRGKGFSIIDINGNSRITSRGLKYELSDSLLKSPTHGLSNIAVGNEVKISVANGGMILVIDFAVISARSVIPT